MNQLIIICGLGGSGKTTIAKHLSQKLNLACLHKDSLKVFLHETLNFKTQDTYKLYFKLIEEQVQNKAKIIIESTFTNPKDIELIQAWEEKYKFHTKWIICEAPKETRIQRINSRQRHSCHQEADQEYLKEIENSFVEIDFIKGDKIRINTSQKLEISIQEILEFLNN